MYAINRGQVTHRTGRPAPFANIEKHPTMAIPHIYIYISIYLPTNDGGTDLSLLYQWWLSPAPHRPPPYEWTPPLRLDNLKLLPEMLAPLPFAASSKAGPCSYTAVAPSPYLGSPNLYELLVDA